jgi:hypothetical protein
VTSIRRKTWTRGRADRRAGAATACCGRDRWQSRDRRRARTTAWLPVAIEIPGDQQATNDALDNDIIYWQLEAMAPMAGIDYYSRFEVPVYVR